MKANQIESCQKDLLAKTYEWHDNTPYRTANTLDEVIQSLEHDSMMLFQWFSDNQMKKDRRYRN